jgi:hypothetical protein
LVVFLVLDFSDITQEVGVGRQVVVGFLDPVVKAGVVLGPLG